MNPTWNGYSTARWEGDALVVLTKGFRDELWLDAAGNPLTESGTTDRDGSAGPTTGRWKSM